MSVIRLGSNQSFDVPAEGFSARMEFDVSGGLGFRVEVPSAETNRRGNTWWIRNPRGNTEVTVFPDSTRGEFPSGTKLYVSIITQDVGGKETTLQLPTYPIGGLRSIPVLNIFPGGGGIRLQAGDVSNDNSLDSEASGIRSALGRSIEKDGFSEVPRTSVTVLVDKTASMKFSTDRDTFDTMCAFAAGVLSVASSGHSISLMSSSSADPKVRLESPEDVSSLSDRFAPVREVGWNSDLRQISPDDAVVVISDDIPAEVLKLPNTLHVLCSRKPLVEHGTSTTYFDPPLIDAIKNHDQRLLTGPVRRMFDSLTGSARQEESR